MVYSNSEDQAISTALPVATAQVMHAKGWYVTPIADVGAVWFTTGVEVFDGQQYVRSDSLTAAFVAPRIAQLRREIDAITTRRKGVGGDAVALYALTVELLLQADAVHEGDAHALWQTYEEALTARLPAELLRDVERLPASP